MNEAFLESVQKKLSEQQSVHYHVSKEQFSSILAAHSQQDLPNIIDEVNLQT